MGGTVPGRGAGGRSPAEEGPWPATSLLGGLTGSARERLLHLGTRVRYGAGRVLMREADLTAFVLVLLDGLVKVTGRAHDGRDALLAIRMGGDAVGELAAVDGAPRSATVTTCGPVVARVAQRDEFLACLRDDPRIAHAVNASVVTKLRLATTHRVDFTGCDVPTRLARVLYKIATTHGERTGGAVEIRWPITQPELATLAGAAEPTVQKVLRRLRDEGIVSTGYRTIRIDDLVRLHGIAFDQP